MLALAAAVLLTCLHTPHATRCPPHTLRLAHASHSCACPEHLSRTLTQYYCAAARRAYLVVPEIGVLKWLLEIRKNGVSQFGNERQILNAIREHYLMKREADHGSQLFWDRIFLH